MAIDRNLIYEYERVFLPHRADDAQVQRSGLYNEPERYLTEACREAMRDYPGKRFNGFRYEIVLDGANKPHHNLTAYFSSDGPTLDHSNLNGVEQAVFGQYLTPAELERLGIGRKDQRA